MALGFSRLDPSVLRTLYRHELRMLMRDRRTVLIAVVAPLVLYPLLILLMRFVSEREEQALEATTFRYAIAGVVGEAIRPVVTEAVLLAGDDGPDSRIAAAGFEEVEAADPEGLLQAGDIHLVVRGVTPEEWRTIQAERLQARREEAGPGADTAAIQPPTESDRLLQLAGAVPIIQLRYRENSDRSGAAAQRMEERLRVVREQRRGSSLAASGFPIPLDSLAPLETVNVASAEREGGALLGQFLTTFLVLLMLTGGSIVAVDTIAGEKERGTLENLLTTAARRGEIVTSKQLAVITVGLAITLINVLNLLLYLSFGVIDLPEALSAVRIDTAGAVVLLLLYLPIAVLVSSALLLLSGFSKSFKEYQVYFFPVFLLFLLPTLVTVLPGMELRSLISIVPLANVSIAVREVMIGDFDWLFLAVAFVSTAAAAVYAAGLTAKALSTERLITASELDRADLVGGPALFPRRVLRWFGVMWAVFLIMSVWIGAQIGVRGQVVLNLVVLFLGGSILMIWRYRLPVREALALRSPHPAVWPAVVVGVPAALIAGQGLAGLLDYVVPVPEDLLEAFGRSVVADMGLWQALFFVALLPGICEEVAFRGVLLYGLRRKLSPVGVVLAVGAIFGFFHVDLFRIGPTAYIGMILTTVVLLTGSIYPAILWHALNNAIALAPEYVEGFPEGELPDWSYFVSVAILALVFSVLWATRRPYPGLRPRSRAAVATLSDEVGESA